MLYAVALASSFNLVCTGTETESANAQPQQNRPFTITLRLDLKSARWCSGECELTNDIVSVKDNAITLENGSPLRNNVTTILQRETGRYVSVSGGFGHSLIDMAMCQRTSFGGFPAAKF